MKKGFNRKFFFVTLFRRGLSQSRFFAEQKGFGTLELLFALLGFLLFTSFLVSPMAAFKENAKEAGESLKAESDAIECVSAVEGLYANSAEEVKGVFSCTAKEGEMEVKGKKVKTFVPSLQGAGKGKKLLVKNAEHYGG